MKILVIGGSYFYGRVFVMLASKEYKVTVANRGTYSMEEFGVSQVTGDRRDASVWQRCMEDYDAIVDFCAYNEGDIAFVLDNLSGKAFQYILISTVDVYERGRDRVLAEDAPFETRQFTGETGTYITGKVALEGELRQQCKKRGINWTVLRPAILYGPYNYAPRESLYIQMAVQEHKLPEITDATGCFQLVYVKDAAEAVIKCLGNSAAYGQAYNLCQDGSTDYHSLIAHLRRAAEEHSAEKIQVFPVTSKEAQSLGVPLPFPVSAEETERYSNEKSRRELGLTYISLSEGIARTYKAFEGVFGN